MQCNDKQLFTACSYNSIHTICGSVTRRNYRFTPKIKISLQLFLFIWSQDYFFIQPINTENVKAWYRRPFVGRNITVMSHERWAVSNHRQSTTGNSLFMPTTRKRLKLRITGPLWGESTDGLTKRQKCEMCFHVMTSPLIVHHGCKIIQS